MLESAIQARIMAKLRKQGYFPVKCGLMSVTGFPDILVLGNHGKCFFIECKQPGKKPTKLQEYAHSLIRVRGFKVFVLDSDNLPEEITTL